jgi:RNA polymerase sigma-70 factor (ECF subfamily)
MALGTAESYPAFAAAAPVQTASPVSSLKGNFAGPYWESASGMRSRRQEFDPGGSVSVSEGQISDLIERVAAREKEAFAQLFRYFAPRIKAYGIKGGLGAAMAEELAQETMISVWRGAHSFDRGRASGSTWMFTIARNRRVDLWRRESHPEIDADDPVLAGQPEPQPDHIHETRQAEHTLRDAVEALPPDQATVLRKAYFEDKSHNAISEELGLALGTVKSRVRLGLARLRVLMAGFQP